VNFVFDANALIAYLEDEPGAELVEQLLGDLTNTSFVHAINLCEVYYGARREHGEEAAQSAIAELRSAGLSEAQDMDEAIWHEAGRLKADYRRISLADCFCAALANRVGGELVTADREYEPLNADGACRVRFIR
jgi:predicted nucleic acid-binding protein